MRFLAILLSLTFLSTLALAEGHEKGEGHGPRGDGPCKEKREAKHSARKSLHECLEGWAKSGRPDSTLPSDDCSSRLSAFVSAAKDVHACHQEAKANKEKK